MARHNESTMRIYYDKWQCSGLSKKAFATQEGLSCSTFYYWVGKFEGSARNRSSRTGFASIAIEEVVCEAVIARVRYPSGVVVEWHGSPDTVHFLKQLL